MKLIEINIITTKTNTFITWFSLTLSVFLSNNCLAAKKFNNSLLTNKHPLKVLFISPDVRGNPYWDFVSNTMRKAAKDFGMQLTTIHSSHHDLHNFSLLIDQINNLDKPDFLIYVYQYKLGKKLLDYGEQHQIKSFIINTNISDNQRQHIGRPTEKYKNWIGHSFADLSDISFELSKKAYNLAKPLTQVKEDKQVYGIVLSGSRDSDLAFQWNYGANQADRELADFEIKQTVYTSFNPAIGYEKAKKLLQRYPDVSVILSIDENVALSAIKAAEELGRKPGKDIFIAGSASLLPTFDMAEQKKLLASYALSMWFGVHAIVYLHDYYSNQYDQIKEFSYNFADTNMLTSQIPTYRKIITKNTWQNIDYRRFSLAFSPHLQRYDFSLHAFKKSMQAIK